MRFLFNRTMFLVAKLSEVGTVRLLGRHLQRCPLVFTLEFRRSTSVIKSGCRHTRYTVSAFYSFSCLQCWVRFGEKGQKGRQPHSKLGETTAEYPL